MWPLPTNRHNWKICTGPKLQHTIAPMEPFSVWQDAGLQILGNGTPQVLFDPAGYDSAKAYRVIDTP